MVGRDRVGQGDDWAAGIFFAQRTSSAVFMVPAIIGRMAAMVCGERDDRKVSFRVTVNGMDG